MAIDIMPPQGVQGTPVIVIPGQPGESTSYGVNATIKPIESIKEVGQARPDMAEVGSKMKEILDQQKPYKYSEEKKEASPPSPGPKPVADSPAPRPGESNIGQNWGRETNSWGASEKIKEAWSRHEASQRDLQSKIDLASQHYEKAKAEGKDTTKAEYDLKMAESKYAMNEHMQAARSWTQTAAFAKATNIGGISDTQTSSKAESMRDHHRSQAASLQAQQVEMTRVYQESKLQNNATPMQAGQAQDAKAQENQQEVSTQKPPTDKEPGVQTATQGATEPSHMPEAKKEGLSPSVSQSTAQQAPESAQGDERGDGKDDEAEEVKKDDAPPATTNNQEVNMDEKSVTQGPQQQVSAGKTPNTPQGKSGEQEYDPYARVRETEAKGQAIKERNQSENIQSPADNTDQLKEQSKQADDYSKQYGEGQERKKEKTR